MKIAKSLRITLLALCTAVAGATALHAQDGPPSPPPGGGRGQGGPEQQQRQLDRMTKELSLTPDQVTQIKAIQDDGRTQMMALRNDTTVAGPDRRAKMMAMRETEQTKIKAVLTDDQKVKYDAMMAKMQERRQDAPPPPPPPAN